MNTKSNILYTSPKVMSHQQIRFETAHSWNPGCGAEGKHNGNNGENWPKKNPNPTPDGAGANGNHICKPTLS